MAVKKSAATQIGQSLATTSGASFVTDPLDVTAAFMADIEVLIVADPAPLSGTVNIEIYASQDGVNFSSRPVYTNFVTPRLNTHRAVFPINVRPFSYIQIKVTNNTDVTADIIVRAVTAQL